MLNSNIEKEKQALLNLDVGRIGKVSKLIHDAYNKYMRRVSNLETINHFTHKKENIIHPKELDLSDKKSVLEYKDSLLEEIEEEANFYDEKYKIYYSSKKKQDISQLSGLNFSLYKATIDKLTYLENKWRQEEIEKIYKEIWEELKKKILVIEEVKHSLESLDEEGIFWTLLQGNALNADIKTLTSWSKELSRNNKIKEIIDLIGRSIRQKMIKTKELVSVERQIPILTQSLNSKEEITSVEFGNDLMRVVPQELNALTSDELEILFYKKFVEKSLLCYRLEGAELEQTSIKQLEEKEVEKEEKKGPIIVCVDTSGSMSGLPETVAKACTLSLASLAIKESRSCHIINFSTKISTFTFNEELSMDKLIKFLKMSFHGGTDVSPALDHALEMLTDDEFEKADVLIISDFIMNAVSDATLEDILLAKEFGTKFYGLNIGDDTFIPDYLDKQWIYTMRDDCILELSHEIA